MSMARVDNGLPLAPGETVSFAPGGNHLMLIGLTKASKAGDKLPATLVFASGVEVSARPSDAIALALRTGTTIVCSDEVLAEAGVAVPAEQEDEVERFREFLDQVTPDDFEAL